MSEEQALVKSEQTGKTQVMNYGKAGVQIQSLEEAYRFAKYVVAAGFAPKGLEKPESVLIAMQHGAELGMTPMQSLQSIAIINGRPGIYGDAALSLVRGSGLCESYRQSLTGTGDERKATVYSKRRDDKCEITSEFSIADAKRAGLWGKSGPWSQYPERMLLFRARGFNLRDNFGDVLKGLRTTEELQDSPPMKIAEGIEVVTPEVQPPTHKKGIRDAAKKAAPPPPQVIENKEPEPEESATDNQETGNENIPISYVRDDVEKLMGSMKASAIAIAFDTVGLEFSAWPFELSDDQAIALKSALVAENNKKSRK